MIRNSFTLQYIATYLHYLSTPPGAAHVAFSAPSRQAVEAFFTAALKAGGRIHGAPACRDAGQGYYSAAVLDFDDNAVEVVYHPEVAAMRSVTADSSSSSSRAISLQENGSTLKTIANIFTTTTTPTITESLGGSKALVGTLIGAAAGAAIAYAMVKSEQPHTPPTTPGIERTTAILQAIEAPPTPPPAPMSVHSSHSQRHSSVPSAYARSIAPTYARAIEAPSTMVSGYQPSEITRRALPPSPSVHTLVSSAVPSMRELELAPMSVVSRASKTSRALSHVSSSHSARAPSYHSAASTIKPAKTRQSSRAPSAVEYELPLSRKSSRAPSAVEYIPEPGKISRAPSTYSVHSVKSSRASSAVNYELPPSQKTSVAPSAVGRPLPPSRKTSIAPSTTNELPRSKKSSRAPSAADHVRLVSRKSSLAETAIDHPIYPAAYPLPLSIAPSDVSQSTVKSLSRKNVEKARHLYACTEIDDADTVVPGDSISQVGLEDTKHHHHRRRRRSSKKYGSESGSRLDTRDSKSEVPSPPKKKEGRSVVSIFGLGK